MRLRQVVLAVQDIAAVENDFRTVFGWEVAFRDPIVGKWGLQNSIIPVGGEFIELVSPTQENTSAGRHMARIGGDGGYMLMVQVADRAAETERLSSQGVRIAYRSDQETYCLTQFHPGDCGGLILAVEQVLHPAGADWSEPMGYWHAADGFGWHKHVVTDRVGAMRRVVIGNGSAEELAATYSRLLGRPIENRADIAQIHLDGPNLGFVDRAMKGAIARIELEAVDREAVLAAARARGLLEDGDAIRIAGVSFCLV